MVRGCEKVGKRVGERGFVESPEKSQIAASVTGDLRPFSSEA